MFVLGNFVRALAVVLDYLLWAYMWVIIIRALISWVNPDPYNPIVRFLVAVTEPVLAPLRRLIPTWRLGIDISPIFAILIVIFLQQFLVRTLFHLAVILQ